MLAQIGQTFAQAGQYLGQYPTKVQVAYRATDKEGTTFATVGAGNINVSDTAKQAALEKGGITAALNLLNRDVAHTQIITRNTTDAVNVYVSTEALAYAAKGIPALADYLKSTGVISNEGTAHLADSGQPKWEGFRFLRQRPARFQHLQFGDLTCLRATISRLHRYD